MTRQINYPGNATANFPADTYWSVDGVSLQTYAFNIETLGDARLTLPPPRGSNLAVPFQVGQRYVPKMPDSRTLTLAMWVQGSDEWGNPPESSHMRQQYETNYRKLRKLLWVYGRQFQLTKRFLDDDGHIVTATALAEFAGGLAVTKEGGPYRGKFSVDILLADPFFYGAPVVLAPTRWNVSTAVSILGDYATDKGTITLAATGSVVSPQFWLGGEWLRVNTTLAAGATLRLDLGQRNAHVTIGASTTNVNNLIAKSSLYHWLVMTPGVQQLQANFGNGVLPTLSYTPAYL